MPIDLFAEKPAKQPRDLFASQPEMQAAPQSMDTAGELPWYAQAGQAADDIARLIANGATFGYADKLAGFMGGDGTEAERDLTNQAKERAGSAGTVAEIGGAVATPVGLASRGATLAGRFGTGAMKGMTGLAARTGLMAAEGAGYGALTAAGNDQDIGKGAGIGLVAGGAGNVVGEALSAGVGKVASKFNKSPKIPPTAELEALKTAAYKRADDAGVAFTPGAVTKLRDNIVKDFSNHGFLPANEPGAAAVLSQIEKMQGQNVTLKGLDTIRKMAGNAYVPGNKSNNALTSKIIQNIDDLVASPASDDILMGNAKAGQEALAEARALASRTFKADKVAEALSKADLRSASTGSGGNVDNATRQNIRRLLEKPRGFSPDEKEAMEAIVRGTPGQNALRLAGKLSPSGNGLMAALGVGGTMVNPLIGVASLGGMGAKTVADALTQRNVQELSKIIAAGGSKSATQAAPNAVQRLAQSKRETIARLLMGLGVSEAVAP